MQRKDLEVFNDMPFFFWVKCADGVYLRGNRAINEFAGEDVTGKPDRDLTCSANADALRAENINASETGERLFALEHAGKTTRGEARLSAWKFIGNFEGKRCAFGVSFIVK